MNQSTHGALRLAALQKLVNEGDWQARRAVALAADIERLTKRYDETEHLLKLIGQDIAKARRNRDAAEAEAADMGALAQLVCAETGWEMPEAAEGPPVEPTTAFPAVSPDGATQVIAAVPWVGLRVGQMVHVYRENGGHVGGPIVEMTPTVLVLDAGDGATVDISPGDVARIMAADLDQVAKTQAQPEGEADHG